MAKDRAIFSRYFIVVLSFHNFMEGWNAYNEGVMLNIQVAIWLKSSIKGEVIELRKDISNIEIITSSNWNDIAKLNAIKQVHRNDEGVYGRSN